MDNLRLIKKELAKNGFARLPRFKLNLADGKSVPLVLFTNCCIYPFTAKNRHTSTKTYYAPTGRRHLVNITAAAALQLIEAGRPVIVHLPPKVANRVKRLFRLHPAAHLIHFLTGNLYACSFIRILYKKMAYITRTTKIARLDICLYDSYANGLTRPFLPMFEDSPHTAAVLAGKRIHLLHHLAMVGYDLLANKGQKELRFICPTALACRRASSHLFTDTIHKAISNVALVTLGYEMPFYTKKQAAIIEIAPGIVDTGLYDSQSVRAYTAQEAMIDGFPKMSSRLAGWPMISIADLATVTVAYLLTPFHSTVADKVNSKLLQLTLAGRSREELFSALRDLAKQKHDSISLPKKLPDYCYTPGTVWHGFPSLRSGYIPVMLTPPGQFF